MLYRFKSQPEDFVVEELLDFVPTGTGDILYVYFEKKNMNTMDIIGGLGKELWLPRSAFGIAGLKDKQAVTRQRITIYKSQLGKTWGEENFCTALEKYGKIIQKTWHGTPLRVWQNAGNRFVVTIRATKKISEAMKQQITIACNRVKEHWFPNCFGVQRFGKGMRNFQRARDVIEGKIDIKGDFELKFKLQAYGSAWFNTYTLARYRSKDRLLEWDIVVNKHHAFGIQTGVIENKAIKLFDYKKCKEHYPEKDYLYPDFFTETIPLDMKTWKATGPILGNNIILPPQWTPAWEREWKLLKKINFFLGPAIDFCRAYKIFWLRRVRWVVPENMVFSFAKNDDMVFSFSLPTGAYATTLLGTVFQDIDAKTVVENWWIFPEV